MSIFSRLFKVGQAEVHALADTLEDPIKLSEQGIRDLKQDLGAAMQSLAEVKGLTIRLNKEAGDATSEAQEYERKAVLLLQRGKSGELPAAEADRLATAALAQKEQVAPRASALRQQASAQQKMADELQRKITQLKATVTSYENELVTLRARAQTAASTKKINQQLAQVDSSSTIAMLERMKQKVEEEEALSQAYGEVADQNTGVSSVDAEINRALLTSGTTSAEDSLAALKAKLGIVV